MAKGIEYFIAQRTSRDEKRGGGGVMMPVAKIAVGLSIAVMIITLAVILGFKREIHTKFTSLSGQLLLTSIGGGSVSDLRSIKAAESLKGSLQRAAGESGVELLRVAPYASRATILRTTSTVEGVVVKGLDSAFDMSLFERGLIEGEVPDFGGERATRNTLVSKLLADEMGLKVGDRLELLTTADGGEMKRDLYRVGAIYTQSLGDAEKYLIVTDIRNIQRLNGWAADQITGYEVWISDLDSAPAMAESLNEWLLFNEEANGVAGYATQSIYPSVFDWLKAHDVNALVIITIMMIVAIFNITTALLILVLERTQLIGLLKSFGMANSSIRRIFLYRALSIAGWGMIGGNVVAIGLCLIQKYWGVAKLDEDGYMLSQVPIDLGVDWIAMLNIGVVAVILLLVILPTRMISAIEPSKAIKFE